MSDNEWSDEKPERKAPAVIETHLILREYIPGATPDAIDG